MTGDCGSDCIAAWDKRYDNYLKCLEQEENVVKQMILQEPKVNNQDSIGVSESKGKVSIQQPDGTFKELTVGTVLKDGDVIKSDKKSSVSITLADGHTITLASNSKFIYYEDTLYNTIVLMHGKIHSKLNRFKKKFEVRSPPAVLGVRGTDFIIDYNPDTTVATIYLYGGIVDVTNLKNETFELNAGEMMTVDLSGKTVKSELNESEWNRLTYNIETGEEPISSDEKQKTTTLIVIAIVVLIVLGVLLIKKFKKK